jgi:hypothetical protein
VAITPDDLGRRRARRVRRTAVPPCGRRQLSWSFVTFAHSRGRCGGDDADASHPRLPTHTYALAHDSTVSMTTTGPSTAHLGVGRGITTRTKPALLGIISDGAGRAARRDLASLRGASSGCRRSGLVGGDRRTPWLRECVSVRRSQAERPGVSTACGASGQKRALPGVVVARRAGVGVPAWPVASTTAWTTPLEFTIISRLDSRQLLGRTSWRHARLEP